MNELIHALTYKGGRSKSTSFGQKSSNLVRIFESVNPLMLVNSSLQMINVPSFGQVSIMTSFRFRVSSNAFFSSNDLARVTHSNELHCKISIHEINCPANFQ